MLLTCRGYFSIWLAQIFILFIYSVYILTQYTSYLYKTQVTDYKTQFFFLSNSNKSDIVAGLLQVNNPANVMLFVKSIFSIILLKGLEGLYLERDRLVFGKKEGYS